jgi:ArsR family transcriptional regulator, virulence genes transcriptional regulator
MHVKDMEAVAEHVSELMKSLSHKHRLLTLCQLVEGEKAVGELAAALDLSQPAMSQQLALLRRDGLVSTRREGQTVYYALPEGEVKKLLRFLYKTYCG